MTTLTLTLPKPHKGQREVLNSQARFNVVACGRRFGKTTLGIDRLIEPALYGYPVGWFSPTYKMMSEVWQDLRSTLQPVTRRCSLQERRLELITDGVIDMWSLDNPDVARGRKYKRVVLDEAAMVPKLGEAWQAAIRPTLTDYEGDAWFLSTPKGRNFFKLIYDWGQDPANGEWQAWRFPTIDNPFIKPQEIEAARQELPSLVFKQEYLAEFLEAEGTVFRNIAACLTELETDPAQHQGHHIIAGVDWAKLADFTAISLVCRDCRREVAHDRFNQIDYHFQRERLKALCEKWNVSRIIAESNAMGEPMIDELARERLPVEGFKTTSLTKPDLIESLALCFEKEESKWINNPIWTAELEAYEIQVNKNGRPSFSAPEGYHDDTVIARALAWYGVAWSKWRSIDFLKV